jgi:hypothetical protein
MSVNPAYISHTYDLSEETELLASIERSKEVEAYYDAVKDYGYNTKHTMSSKLIISLLKAGLKVQDYDIPYCSLLVDGKWIVTNGGVVFRKAGSAGWRKFKSLENFISIVRDDQQ